MEKYNKQKTILSNMMNEFLNVKSVEKMLSNYKWFSLASGIKDDELTLKIMNEIIEEKIYYQRIK